MKQKERKRGITIILQTNNQISFLLFLFLVAYILVIIKLRVFNMGKKLSSQSSFKFLKSIWIKQQTYKQICKLVNQKIQTMVSIRGQEFMSLPIKLKNGLLLTWLQMQGIHLLHPKWIIHALWQQHLPKYDHQNLKLQKSDNQPRWVSSSSFYS